ncbi:MAG: hypothetical protein R6W31_12610 [Bacteroidales bacterium]
MKRREFLSTAGPTAFGISMLPGTLFAENNLNKMTAKDLNAFLRSLIVVKHGTTEEFGMRELSLQLNKAVSKYETIHFKQGWSIDPNNMK